MKHILFFGDLRKARNYGAIATTETLIRLLSDERYDAEFQYIDFKGFENENGKKSLSSNATTCHCSSFVSRFLSKIERRCQRLMGKDKKLNAATTDNLPYKFSQYEDYFIQIEEGHILQRERELLTWSDIVYINGEGNIVNGTDQYGKYRMRARYLLFLAWVAKVKYGKTVIIVNHTVDPNNDNVFEIISNLYPRLDKVLVRERLSLPVLESHGVHNAQFVPDALFAYCPKTEEWKPSAELSRQIDFSKPYICLGDSSGIRNGYGKVRWNVYEVYKQIIDELRKNVRQIVFVDGFSGTHPVINQLIRQEGLGYVNLYNCSYHDLYQVFKRASLFVSGRWHSSILCTLANTPILLWGADSHKTRSLYELLDYPYRFFEVNTLPANIPELGMEVRKVLDNAVDIKKNMAEKVKIYSKEAQTNAEVLREYISE